MCAVGMCEPGNHDNGASDVWALTAYKQPGKQQLKVLSKGLGNDALPKDKTGLYRDLNQ